MAGGLSAGQVSVAVKPDTSKFSGDLKSGILGGASGLGDSLGKTLLKGLGLVGIATSIGGAIKTGFGELSDASKGTAQLAAGIKSTGDAAHVTVDGLNSLASSIQGYSGQTDDSIVKSEQLLLTFTNIKNNVGAGNDIFNQATKATADLAAKMGGDASGAAIQLGKALNDPSKGITALTRVGVSFTEQQKNQIKAMQASGDTMGAQKIILGELNKEFGGAAAAYGQSLPGMIDRMKRSWEDLTQTLAGTLLPIINPILTGLLALFQKVQPVVQRFADKMTGFFTQLASGGLSFQGVLKMITDGVSNFLSGGGLANIIQSMGDFRTKLVNALVDILPTIIQGLANTATKLLPELVQSYLQMIPQLLITAQKLFGALITALSTVIPQLLGSIVAMLPRIVSSLTTMLPGVIQGALDLFFGLVQGLVKALPKLLTAIVDSLPKIISSIVSMLPDIIQGAIKLFVGLITGLMQVTPDLVKAVIGMVPVLVKALLNSLPLIVEAGFQIVTGLIKGILDNAPALIAKAASTLGSTLVSAVKAVLGIHSPSLVFHEIGGFVAEGMQNGITEGSTGVIATAGRMSADMVDRVKESLTTLRDAAATAVADAKKALSDYASSVKDALSGGINFSQALSDEDTARQAAKDSGKTFGGSFIDALKAQADKATKFTDDIKALVKAGLSKDALQQVLQAGQDAGDRIAQELLTGGSTTIKQANDLIAAAEAAAKAAADSAAGAYYNAGVKLAQSQLDGYNATLGAGQALVAAKTVSGNGTMYEKLASASLAAMTGTTSTPKTPAAPTIIYNAAKNDSISSEQKLTDAVNRAAVLARTGGL